MTHLTHQRDAIGARQRPNYKTQATELSRAKGVGTRRGTPDQIERSANAYASGALIGLGLALAAAAPIIYLSLRGPSPTITNTPAQALLPEAATSPMAQLPLQVMSQTVDPNAQRLSLSGVRLDQLSGMPKIWVHEILTGEDVQAKLPSTLPHSQLAGDPALWQAYAGCTEIVAYPAQGGGVVLVGVRYGIADIVRYLPAAT